MSRAAFDSEVLCLNLLRADAEDEVAAQIAACGLDAAEHWRPLGGIENNLSIAGNQQSNPTAALVEKLVNSIDSLLIREALLQGIPIESDAAPQTMAAAAATLFGLPDGSIARLAP